MNNKTHKKKENYFGGNWTENKLTIIEDYLSVWTTAFKKMDWVTKVYIDGFSGTGTIITNDGIKIDGSASIALKYDFHTYYFIESDAKKASKLKELIALKYPAKIDKVKVLVGCCNEELPKLFTNLSGSKSVRGVLFLDPFALECKFDTIRAAKEINIDIWYWFPLMSNRLIPEDMNKINAKNCQKLNDLLGGDGWKNIMYGANQRYPKDLFGETPIVKQPIDSLVDYFSKQITKLTGYKPQHEVFKSSKNLPIFLLCFFITNPNEKATRLAKKIVSAIFEKFRNQKLEWE